MQARDQRGPQGLSCQRIDGQPTDEDITGLKSELSAMVASIPTTNGGGFRGRVGRLCEGFDYSSFLHNAKSFTISTNPGPHPTTPTNANMRAQQEAEHKVHVIEFGTYFGVAQSMHLKIANPIDP